MTRYNASNNWETTIDMVGGLGDGVGDTTLTVADASGHPTVPFKVTVNDEIMNVTAVATNDFTVERGQEGTTRAAHDDGAKVENFLTAEMYENLWDEVESLAYGNWDGGEPDSNYGGFDAIDGGEV